jgi:hypothetical protein
MAWRRMRQWSIAVVLISISVWLACYGEFEARALAGAAAIAAGLIAVGLAIFIVMSNLPRT